MLLDYLTTSVFSQQLSELSPHNVAALEIHFKVLVELIGLSGPPSRQKMKFVQVGTTNSQNCQETQINIIKEFDLFSYVNILRIVPKYTLVFLLGYAKPLSVASIYTI